MTAPTDEEIGAYWDCVQADWFRGIPDEHLAALRRRYVADVRANPEALRRIADALAGEQTTEIRYVAGDATDPTRPAIIAHVCNDAGYWGAGFSGAVSLRWPEPEEHYRRAHHHAGLRLGDVLTVSVEPGLWVANMVAQHGIRSGVNPTPIRCDALRTCLAVVAGQARGLGVAVVMPRRVWGCRWRCTTCRAPNLQSDRIERKGTGHGCGH